MTHPVRMLASCAATFAVAFSFAADAAPLDDYLAAREKAVAELMVAVKAGKLDDEATMKRDEAAVADLEKRMKAIVGPVKIKGLGSPGFSLPILVYEDGPTRMLDGITVSNKDGSANALVTPEPLFQAWLAARAKDKDAPAEFGKGLSAAAQSDYFYTFTVANEGTITPYTALPVAAVEGETALAALALHSDDSPRNNPPSSIVVVRLAEGKATIAVTELKGDVKAIAACDALWKPFATKIAALQAAAEKENKDDDPRWDEIAKLEDDGGAAFRTCFVKEVPSQPVFAAATKQAEAFLQAVRGK